MGEGDGAKEECEVRCCRCLGYRGLSGEGSNVGEKADFVDEFSGCRYEGVP